MRYLLIVATVLLAACTAQPPLPPSPVPPTPAPVAPAPPQLPPTVDSAADGLDRPTATIGASSADATSSGSESPILQGVRTGQQDGADRLVFEFNGVGLPAWHVEYVDKPVRDCGTGDAVPVQGDAWLQVRFSGAQAHSNEGASTSGPRRRAVGQSVLRELVRTCDFEGEVTWVAGVARPNPYTPKVLESPPRLVIDIAH